MISSVLDLILTSLVLFIGVGLGRIQASNKNISNQFSNTKDIIDEIYEKQNVYKQLWIEAEQQAETWKRRYLSLVPEDKESSIGS